MTLSVIVVTYNIRELSRQCLRAIKTPEYYYMRWVCTNTAGSRNFQHRSRSSVHQFAVHRHILDNNIRVSMDGRGRFFDNVFVERLWRSVKYEEVYLKDYQTIEEAYRGLASYFGFYDTERQHQALNYGTPQEAYQSET